MTYMTKSEYADSRGWSRPYVSKLAKQERLVLNEQGLVDVEATDALLASTADPSKAGVAARHQQERAEKGVHALVTPGAPATLPAVGGGQLPDFQKARARREHYLALLAEDEFLKGRDLLVTREAVDSAAFSIARTLRDLVLGLPAQVAGELVNITDAWEMERKLTTMFRRVLEDAEKLVTLDDGLQDDTKEPN
ncbi:hypothetical protein D9M70_357190 [compost metagenome]